MNVVVTTEHRFFRTPDSAVWTDGAHAYSFWSRYCSVFDGVKVVARVREAPGPETGWRPASGPGVGFCAIPDYLGPWQYLAKSVSVGRTLHKAVSAQDAVILRVSSQISGRLESILACRGQPYGVEVVNDPFDVFAPGAVEYPLRPAYRWRFTRQLRRQCSHAAGAAYVTEKALQARYPCPGFASAVSDVEIPAEAIRAVPRIFIPRREQRLITVASLAQMYKGPDVLLRAVAECVRAGCDISLRIVGSGRLRGAMERLATALGIEQRVGFLGQFPAGARVREELDGSDLFVLPSWCEGLPRALVEAMARSLPCVASNVGGIPELLAPEDLIQPGDPPGLARKLMEVLGNPGRMESMAARNLRRAADFREDLLARRRTVFFGEIRRSSALWIGRSTPRPTLGRAETAEY